MNTVHPILAASGSSLTYFLVILAIGILRWLGERGNAAQRSAKTVKPQTTPAPSVQDPEDEQMRKFLKALGLPADEPKPVPPIPQPPAPIPRPPRRVPPPVPILEIENPHLAALEVPEVPQFHTVSAVVTAIPFENVSAGGAGETERARASAELPARQVREMMKSAGGLQTAFALREIFGPPRGLQSSDFPHTFPSL